MSDPIIAPDLVTLMDRLRQNSSIKRVIFRLTNEEYGLGYLDVTMIWPNEYQCPCRLLREITFFDPTATLSIKNPDTLRFQIYKYPPNLYTVHSEFCMFRSPKSPARAKIIHKNGGYIPKMYPESL